MRRVSGHLGQVMVLFFQGQGLTIKNEAYRGEVSLADVAGVEPPNPLPSGE